MRQPKSTTNHNISVVNQQLQMNNCCDVAVYTSSLHRVEVFDGLLVELAVQPEVVHMAADRQLEELPEVRHAVALTTISEG